MNSSSAPATVVRRSSAYSRPDRRTTPHPLQPPGWLAQCMKIQGPSCRCVRGWTASTGCRVAYLGVEAELGKEGVRKVIETPLTESEKALLVEAYEAVKAKQADVKDL